MTSGSTVYSDPKPKSLPVVVLQCRAEQRALAVHNEITEARCFALIINGHKGPSNLTLQSYTLLLSSLVDVLQKIGSYPALTTEMVSDGSGSLLSVRRATTLLSSLLVALGSGTNYVSKPNA